MKSLSKGRFTDLSYENDCKDKYIEEREERKGFTVWDNNWWWNKKKLHLHLNCEYSAVI